MCVSFVFYIRDVKLHLSQLNYFFKAVILCPPRARKCCLFMCVQNMFSFTNMKLHLLQLNSYSFDTVARGDDFLCLRVWQCCLFMCVLNYVFNIIHVKLHLLQLNHFCFMQASSKQLAKDSNSVSTQGKEMLSIHACAKFI